MGALGPSTDAERARAFAERLTASLRATPSRALEPNGMVLKEAAVLAPLFWRGGEPWAYLTKRPMTLRTHPGQIAFPGGRREPNDTTLLHTALRETNEELGIDPDAVSVLGQLGAMPTITGYYVTPFVGWLARPVSLTPSAQEVDVVLEAPLFRLRRETRRFYGADRDAFMWEGSEHVVWGATWAMVNELLKYVDGLK